MLRITKTENGTVRGMAAADARITVFRGIPFAAPPVGNLRWRAPQPAANWKGTLDCLEFKNIAMQRVPGTNPGSGAFYGREWHVDPDVPMGEDCLYLNVWTNAKTGKEKMPVMVWIYGGGLMEGYPWEMEFDGERIARRGVILVSVNYRVNVFGFMTHPEIIKTSPDGFAANWGYLDQKAGIDWVRRNIANFGGDPDNITIFGQSAGGGSVMAHVNSPMARGSFAKAIVQSGGGVRIKKPFRMMMTILTLPQLAAQGEEFFKFIGAKDLAAAKAVDAKTLMAKHLEFNKNWGSTVDGKYVVEDSSISVLNGHQAKIPMMIGTTTDEFLIEPPDIHIEAWAKENVPGIEEEFCKLAREKAADEKISLKKAATVNGTELTASLFCETVAEQGGQTVFSYRFGPEIPGDTAGAFHSSDLWFEFETLAKCWRPFVGKHYDLARQMCNYWTNFAKNGDPNGNDADGSPMPHWDPYTLKSPLLMEFKDKPAMEKKQTKMKKLLLDYNKKLVRQ
ncbi:MAG TPA: carboxylesterase family protein [Dehalococcoidales bacterium]|nr:carboxylesterase family protein [Dehalococcoidales bacterium]